MLRPRRKLPLRLVDEQFCIFLMDNTVICIQDKATDLINFPIQQRLPFSGSKVRLRGAGFLTYSLLDRIVDIAEQVLQRLSQELNDVEKVNWIELNWIEINKLKK